MATITISENTGATYSGLFAVSNVESDPNSNYYTSGGRFGRSGEIQAFQPTDRCNAYLIASGLTNVSTGGTVSNSKLRVYFHEVGQNFTIDVHQILRDQVMNQITWNNYSTGNAWQTAGGYGALDRGSTALASQAMTNGQAAGYVEFAGTGLDQFIQDCIDGVITLENLTMSVQGGGFFEYSFFYNSLYTDGFRPELVFDYDTGGVTLALTGQSITSGQGNLSDSVNSALTGQSSAVQQGNLTDVVSKQLTGQSATVSQGTLSDAVSKELTGQSISMGQGNITPMGDITYALSGQSIAVSQGQLTDNVSKGITGQLIQSNQGTLTDSVLVALDGQQITSQQGNVLFQGDVTRALTGQAVAVQQGSLTLPQESLFGGVAHFSNLDEYNKKKSAKRVEAQQKKLSEKQTAKIQAKKVSDGIVQDTPMQYLESIDDLLIAQNEVIEQNPIVNNQTDLIRDYLIIAQNKKQEEETIAFMIMVLLSN